MNIKNKIKQAAGFQYVIENLELMSSAGRRRMLEQTLLTSAESINTELDRVERMKTLIYDNQNIKPVTSLRHQLMQLHDIGTTLHNLRSHTMLSEVELFEIKNLALISSVARHDIEALGLGQEIVLPELKAVFDLLDPDKTGMPHFYIYDSYDLRLGPLRRQMKAATPDEMGALVEEQNAIQYQVITHLCDQLVPWADQLIDTMELMAYVDYLMARAVLAKQWNLVRPAISTDSIEFVGLVNPRLKDHNEKLHQRYQPVDVAVHDGVCLITGANMAGKTVLLKSIGIAQMMAQMGMMVPAKRATIVPVDDIVFCIGDDQNEMNGLSSFAAEIIKISNTLTRSAQERLLILIDEPARTTNPIEGKAIVQSIANILESRNSITLITTHYSQLRLDCRRLRVRGFVESLSDIPLTPQSINRFIDYSLVEDQSDEVPQEALRIASILNCNDEMLTKAKGYLESEH